MADFRRVVTALAVLALLTGFAVTANAQAPAFACTASAAVPPLLRAEGLTELVGDIVLNCQGGTVVPAGTTIGSPLSGTGLANVSIFLGNTTVTSRILDTGNNSSEALLLIDEPGAPGSPVSTVNIGGTSTALTGTGPSAGCGVGTCTVGGATTPNAFRGIVSNNSVTFIGVPIVPPGTTTSGAAATRIFRITNLRANASTVGAGPSGTPGQVQAFVSISGSTSIPLNNPTQVVGFVQTGLTFSLRNGANDDTIGSNGIRLAQCVDRSRNTRQATLRYTEGFATSFKLRGATSQTLPGAVYNTESGLVLPFNSTALGVTSTQLGLADFGTRLRATFANIPTGINVLVSISNTNAATNRVAQLVASESGPFVGVTPTTTSSNTSDQFINGALTTAAATQLAPVTLTGGTGTAVWEVTQASTLTADNYEFGVYFTATGNAAGNSPATGVQGTISASFAPAPPAFTASAGAAASASLPIPRFIDSGTPRNLVSITVCRTNILFPFVTNQGGFDTGLAIANTSKDPFGTTNQTGTCTLSFFGDNAPSSVPAGDALAAGTTRTYLASTVAPNFQGYVIAVCNFQLAHGFAFISDVGARNLAMGYLGLIVSSDRVSGEALESLGN